MDLCFASCLCIASLGSCEPISQYTAVCAFMYLSFCAGREQPDFEWEANPKGVNLDWDLKGLSKD